MARKSRLVLIQQESPFLDLPGEIREHIYFMALVRGTPIDLWPMNFEEDDTGRIFRIQKDLEFVRKEMATGLIAACKQIYNEAGNIFWAYNIFRFSGDVFWFGARRFLGTIGPRALAQIQSLELFAPLKWTDWEGRSVNNDRLRGRRGYGRERGVYWKDFTAKNRPKMHMIKARAEPWTRDYSRRRSWNWDWTNTSNKEGPKSMLTSNVEHVCHLLATANTGLDLKFIISRQFSVSIPPLPLHATAIWISQNRWHPHDDLNLPGCLTRTLELFNKTATLVVEEGAGLSVELVPHLTRNHLNVLCEAGSMIFQQVPRTIVISEEVRFWDVAAEYDYLIGFPELFEEHQGSDVPALGGRVNKESGLNRTLRVLKSFGGCRFHDRDRWSCAYFWNGRWKCKYRGMPRGGYYQHDSKNLHCTLDREIVIKKKARAARRDLFNTPGQVQL